MRWTLALAAVGACVACGDRNGDAPPRTDSAGGSAIGAGPSTSIDSASAEDDGWIMRPDGVRALRIGMTAAAARTALALPPAAAATPPGECRYIETPSLPVRLYFMAVSDTLVRIDVRDSTVATREGARVGDSEARVNELYAGRVTTQPHKYTGPTGHYLVVTPPGDTNHLIVFETDGARVTNYRVGRKQEVQWVEGCS
jgi:hypothetical protein